MTPSTEPKKKMKFRRRDVRRAIVITLYAFVAIVTVAGMAAPAFIR